jgi:uncharacterized protein YndB with AHSA1/START domain
MEITNAGRRATLTTPSDRELRIERIFDAPRPRVWRALTEPELVKQWWGRGNPLTVERMEVERGGHWRFVEHSDHGDHGFEGRFREVVPPEKLSMTFEWDGAPGHTVVQTMTLEDMGDNRTRMMCTSMFFTKDDLDAMMSSGMEGGMNESYQALDRVLAAMG